MSLRFGPLRPQRKIAMKASGGLEAWTRQSFRPVANVFPDLVTIKVESRSKPYTAVQGTAVPHRALLKHPGGRLGWKIGAGWLGRYTPSGGGAGSAGTPPLGGGGWLGWLGWAGLGLKISLYEENPLQKFSPAFHRGEAGPHSGTPP
jgi:hypothetical protein